MKVKIDHVNISVANLGESIKWYKEVFGFEPVESGKTTRGQPWAIVANNDSMICMTEYKGRTSADGSEDENTHQIYHFGLRVADDEQWKATILKFGLRLYYGGEIEYPHSRSWYVHDPSGHEIEVSYTKTDHLRFPQ